MTQPRKRHNLLPRDKEFMLVTLAQFSATGVPLPVARIQPGAFNRFFFALTERVANADAPPQWLPDSPNRPGNAD